MARMCGGCGVIPGFIGTPLERVTFRKTWMLQCKRCKRVWDTEISGLSEGNACKVCGGEIVHPLGWRERCPKCKAWY